MGKLEDAAVGKRLRQARKTAGLDVVEAARATGQSPDTIRAHEKGSRGVRPEVAAKYARLYGVDADWLRGSRGPEIVLAAVLGGDGGMPVVGSVAAGAFREALEQQLGEPERLPVGYDPAYGQARQFALRIEGPTMNLAYPSGSFVICVSAEDSEPRIGDHVICRRHRAGLYEFSIRELAIDPKSGRLRLVPKTVDPAHAAPVDVDSGELEIIAIVIGSYVRRQRRGPAAFGATGD